MQQHSSFYFISVDTISKIKSLLFLGCYTSFFTLPVRLNFRLPTPLPPKKKKKRRKPVLRPSQLVGESNCKLLRKKMLNICVLNYSGMRNKSNLWELMVLMRIKITQFSLSFEDLWALSFEDLTTHRLVIINLADLTHWQFEEHIQRALGWCIIRFCLPI